MAKQNAAVFAFNRGIVSPLALARVDIQRMAFSAQVMSNWMPRTLGSMMLRPGFGYLAASRGSGVNLPRYLPFVKAIDDTALVELTEDNVRIFVNDAALTVVSVGTALTNGDFATQYSTTFTVTIASPGVVTYTGADNFANGDPVTLTTTGALPTGLVAGTTYYVINLNAGANTFNLAATAGGAAINTSGSQSGVHTVAAYYFITGWTDADDSGAVSEWMTGGKLKLTGTRFAYARRRQEITVAAGDYNKVHVLRITVTRGPVNVRLGSTAGAQDVVAERTLETGEHLVAFTPTANVHIEINHNGYASAQVDAVAVHAAGDLTLTNGYELAELDSIRYDQSGDIIYLACEGRRQRMLKRYGTYSWSLEDYLPSDGPFRNINASTTTLTPSAVRGDITLTASQDVFTADHVGALFRIESLGQQVNETLTAEDQWSEEIRVSGVGTGRQFLVTISGTWSATIRVQQSIGETGLWTDTGWSYIANTTNNALNDGLDNQIIYYRIGIKTGEYTSGTAEAQLVFATGSNTGVCRVTAVATAKSASASVLSDLGGLSASDNWYEGSWSDERGWPTAVVLGEGRLWWAGQDTNFGSVSDDFLSFDDEVVGDSGPIQRSVGSGPVETIYWLLARQRLTFGAGASVFTARASSLDEPLTPDSYTVRPASSQGSANIQAVRVDDSALFVQRSGFRLFELAPDVNGFNDIATDLSVLAPHIGEPGITKVLVQHQPETRVHCLRSDGTVGILVYDKLEKVRCWVEVELDSATDTVVDMVLLPGDTREDHVYYVVKAAGTTHYLTKWAQESECQGGSLNKQADLFVSYTGVAISTLTGLSHLNGRECVIWADGADRGTGTPAGGSLALGGSYTNVVVGLSYEARWKSTKLAYAAQMGTALVQKKTVPGLGLILYNTHHEGIEYGRDFDTMDTLPQVKDGAVVADNTVFSEYDEPAVNLPGHWDTDARLCLRATAPRPCTVLAAVMTVETHERA